jgi:hypothetical protein
MGGTKRESRWAWSLLGTVLLALSLMAIPAFAQLPTGTILGTVKDTSGGVVAGATVEVQNTETGSSRSVTTGEDGAYRFAGLAVGHYDVKAAKDGFKPVTQRGLVLNVSQEVVTSFALEVGTAAQQVVVTGEAPQVNTTSGTLGGLVSEEKIAELPLNGRNFLDLTLLQPGVSQSTVVINLGGGTQGAIYSSNGAPIISNSFLLDGTPMQTVFGFNGASASGTTLGVDGIREYKVVTNAFSAEYGMNMGSQMTIVSKGGGNQFHGDVFEYLRNRVLDARNFFDTYYQQPGAKRNPQYERNNFGGAFGGPIKKDKTFFWGVYEGLRQVKGFPVIANSIPAACVSESASASHQVDSACDPGITTPFAVDSAVQPLVALYAPSNANYTFTSPETVHYGQMRVDHNLTKDDSLFARYTIEQAYEVVPGPGNDSSNAHPYGFKQFKDTWTSRNQYVTLSESHIFSPTLLNTFRLSFSRTNVPTNYIITDPAVTDGSVSFVGAGTPMGLLVIGSAGNGAPGQTTTMGPDLASPNYHLQNIWSLGDDVFYSKGKHALKFGILFNRVNLVIGETVFDRGRLNFTSCGASGTDALLCFLHNQPSFEFGAIPGGIERRHFNYYTYGFYAQDDWRMTSKLTLNLGLRYEFNTTMREAHGIESALRNLADTAVTQGPIMRNASLKNFSPRVGFAYDPTGKGKTSIRGAFGTYYDVATIGMTTFIEVVGDPPFRALSGFPAPFLTSFHSGFLRDNPGPFSPPFSGYGATNTFPGYSPFAPLNLDDYNVNQPYLMQWNLTVDQQLPAGVGLTVSYVGTRGVHLWGQSEGNPCRPTGYDDAAQTLPNWVNAGNVECPTYPDPSNTFPPTAGIHACSPAVGAPPVIPTGRANCSLASYDRIDTNSRSWYDGLQVSLQKKLAHGLQFQSSYTWSHNLDTSQGQLFIDSELRTNPYAPLNFDKGRSVVDATHNWRFNTLYHFPTWKSQGFASKMVNGWWMGNIISVQTGYGFTPVVIGDRSLSGINGVNSYADRPYIVTSANVAEIKGCPAGSTSGSGYGCNPNAVVYNPATVITGTATQWFNTNMFVEQPRGHLGNVSRGFLTGPGLFNWDFSINKDTKLAFLGESGNLQFRAEFFNLFNHANFNNPDTAITGAGAGGIFVARDGRDIQLALKVNF